MATVADRTGLDTGTLDVRPMTPAIGAEIHGVNLGASDIASRIPEIRAALLRYGVVFFRDQEMTQEQHIAFARHFGDLEIHPATPKDQENPEVLRIVHGPNSRGSENNWHSDVTWRECPSLGSILYAREVPECGGDTLFANMHLAYERLSEKMQQFCEGLTAVHDIARVFAKRLGKTPEELHEKYPPMRHPVIRTHPETGERAIYVNTGFTSHIEGLSRKESDWLLDHLYKTAWDVEVQCRFRWQPNSVAFWDNRVCQHFAVSDYFPARRVMERVTIAGDRPYFTA
ncbi:Alpha-ketoglutarate-dependent taurine dioxygenase [Altererythrobacter epoxidivorans]|uniref:Alpha-ketoglutarate-dependent taurine dioxygenase n=1 Tax=Altererythrobacter epoxidivorans TaxID=361183 RepID=A0A0M4MUW2_9SPHN|nr:TauD/TfdA family dioxygenase [Altererythrobacter epoxidivorans]ALE16200.1 Alpha-ketoglutarate-dependent taurine dioxygenase [Altererythrobacter epoxidivorans]